MHRLQRVRFEPGQQYKDMTDFMKVDFLDAADFITTDGCDGNHFTAENNHSLGSAIADKVEEILARDETQAA